MLKFKKGQKFNLIDIDNLPLNIEVTCVRSASIYVLINGAKTKLNLFEGYSKLIDTETCWFCFHNMVIFPDGRYDWNKKGLAYNIKEYSFSVYESDLYKFGKVLYVDTDAVTIGLCKDNINDITKTVNCELILLEDGTIKISIPECNMNIYFNLTGTQYDWDFINPFNRNSLVDETKEKESSSNCADDNKLKGETIMSNETNTQELETENMENQIPESNPTEQLPIEPEHVETQVAATKLINPLLEKMTVKILELEDANKRNLYKIASHLHQIEENKLYKDDGFKSVSEYGEKVLGYKRQTTSSLVRIATKFLDVDGNVINPDLEGYSVYQLMELLPLNPSQIVMYTEEKMISPDLTTKKIRENVKEITGSKQEKKEESGKEKAEEKPVKKESEEKSNKPSEPNEPTEAEKILGKVMDDIKSNADIDGTDKEYYISSIMHAIRLMKEGE